MARNDCFETICDFDIHGQPCCFYMKAHLNDDGHFYGYASAEERRDDNLVVITHVATGVYKPDLGISVILLSLNPEMAQMVFRGAKKTGKNPVQGDVHSIVNKYIILLAGEQAIENNRITYNRLGKSKFEIGFCNPTYSDQLTLSETLRIGRGLENDFFSEMFKNSFKPEVIKDLFKDLERVYEYENGEMYFG